MTRSPTPLLGRPPIRLAAPALVALAFLVVPVIALFVKAPWASLPHDLTGPAARSALLLSLETTLVSTALCVGLGVPLAWLLARVEFPGRQFVRALVTLPLVMPPVVGGVALLLAFGRVGLLGATLYQG
ncbi:MAG: molybdate ABC transporter permease subunit, partial [Sciscionella sp.]